MTRDVCVQTRGVHEVDGVWQEEVITKGQGAYFFRNGSHFISYEEELPEEGTRQHCYIKMKEGFLEVRRRREQGAAYSVLVFEEGVRHNTRYETPMGRLELGIETKEFAFTESKTLLAASASYTLYMGEKEMQRSRVVIEVRPAEGVLSK